MRSYLFASLLLSFSLSAYIAISKLLGKKEKASHQFLPSVLTSLLNTTARQQIALIIPLLNLLTEIPIPVYNYYKSLYIRTQSMIILNKILFYIKLNANVIHKNHKISNRVAFIVFFIGILPQLTKATELAPFDEERKSLFEGKICKHSESFYNQDPIYHQLIIRQFNKCNREFRTLRDNLESRKKDSSHAINKIQEIQKLLQDQEEVYKKYSKISRAKLRGYLIDAFKKESVENEKMKLIDREIKLLEQSPEELKARITIEEVNLRESENPIDELGENQLRETKKALVDLKDLKIKTIYNLNFLGEFSKFEDGKIINVSQFKKILEPFIPLTAINEYSIFNFFITRLELPDPKLPGNPGAGQKILERYIEITEQLLEKFKMRLEEDIFTFQHICAMAKEARLHLNLETFSSFEESENAIIIRNSLLKENDNKDYELYEGYRSQFLFIDILGQYGYKSWDQEIDAEWITNAIPDTGLGLFKRIVGAVSQEQSFSWIQEDQSLLHITVLNKLRDKRSADISQEFLLSIYRVLARHINKQVLEEIFNTFKSAIKEPNEHEEKEKEKEKEKENLDLGL